ncbi:MAG: biopolymer transporter ExbD [Alphaproteobacteria bacterium]|nr:biopolymer transporter ExbD [Alphaproteobacteria bacterium]
MRRRKTAGDASESPIDLTPMLDIVFIMLIFFIVTATFIREPGIKVTRPETETQQPVKNIAILVAVDAESRIFIDGDEVDPRSLRASIDRLRTENPKGDVVIQADEAADVGVTIQVMETAKAAGAPSVHIATQDD